MVPVVFLHNVTGKQLWPRFGLFGNYFRHVLMTTDNVIAVVLCGMTQQERDKLSKQLLNVWLFVEDIPYEQLAQMKDGSETRMASFLLGPMFVPPPSDQKHLLKPLCDHTGLRMEDVAGTCSVVGAVMALQYALACGLVAIGVI
jgi:hypothetical protein